MTSPVKIILGVEGGAEAKNALKSVRQAVLDCETQATAAAQAGSDKRASIAVREYAARAKGLTGLLDAIGKVDAGLARAGGRGGPSARVAGAGTNSASPVMQELNGGGAGAGLVKSLTLANLAANALTAGFNMATSSLRQFAGFIIGDVIKPGMALQTKSTQMANNSMGKLTAPELMRASQHIGLENNLSPEDIAAQIGKFQDDTGDPSMGLHVMGTLAKISKGKGQDLTSLTGLAAALHSGSGGTLTGEQLQTQIAALTNQGVKGGVPIGELARLGGRFTAPMDKLGGDSYTRALEIGAVMQTAKPKIGTTDHAMSAMEGFIREASSPAAKAISPRSWVKDASGVEKIGDIASLIADITAKTKGNHGALKAAGFTEEGSKLVAAYSGTYESGFKSAKAGGATDSQATVAGGKAVEDFIHSMMNADASMEQVTAERDAVMRTGGERFATGLNVIKDELSAALLPLAGDFASSLDPGEIRDAVSVVAGDLRSFGSAVHAAIDMLPKGTGRAIYDGAKSTLGAVTGVGIVLDAARGIQKLADGSARDDYKAKRAAVHLPGEGVPSFLLHPDEFKSPAEAAAPGAAPPAGIAAPADQGAVKGAATELVATFNMLNEAAKASASTINREKPFSK